MKIIGNGAEACIYLDNNKVIKERVKKGYRLKEIDDKIRSFRTKREAKLLSKLDFVPEVLEVDDKKIFMEFVKGEVVKDFIDDVSKNERSKIMEDIGANVSKMHSKDVIHGDLTTSNMILDKNSKVKFIDFGLGFVSKKVEDKAVDLHLLKQALESKHYRHFEELFDCFLEGYKKSNEDFDDVMKRFEKVEKRGRYKRKK